MPLLGRHGAARALTAAETFGAIPEPDRGEAA